jgi:hypothetical protein
LCGGLHGLRRPYAHAARCIPTGVY